LKRARAEGMSEDDEKLWHDEIQELTNATIRKIDAALSTKQDEIMQF
jgi:ribosome recycling factor